MRNRLLMACLLTYVLGQAFPATAGIIVSAQFTPVSNLDSQGDYVSISDPSSVSLTQHFTYDGATPDDPVQVFLGDASATATSDTFRLDTRLELQNYLRSNYVWKTRTGANGQPINWIDGQALSSVLVTDTVTVTGGEGVYSLNYVLGLDGLITLDRLDGLMSAWIEISLAIPEGQSGTYTVFKFGYGDEIPSEITLSYDDLPFGGPVTPTLHIIAYIFPTPLWKTELAELGNTLFNGTSHVQFGSTITLQQLTATDGNGALIPGLRLSSAEGFSYPTDPNNLAPGGAVPEPSTLTLLAPIAVLAVWRLFAGARSTRRALSPRLPR